MERAKWTVDLTPVAGCNWRKRGQVGWAVLQQANKLCLTVRAALRWRKGGQNRFENPGVIQNAVTDVIGTSFSGLPSSSISDHPTHVMLLPYHADTTWAYPFG